MTTYDSGTTTPPAWLDAVLARTSDPNLIQDAITQHVVGIVIDEASRHPSTDAPSSSELAPGIAIRTEQAPPDSMLLPGSGATDSDTTTKNCHTSSLTVFGVHVYDWLICSSTTTTTTGSAPTTTVHLEAEHPLPNH